MELRDYMHFERISVTRAAKELGKTRTYLSEIMNKKVLAGKKLSLEIEEWSNGNVSRHELRPDIWES